MIAAFLVARHTPHPVWPHTWSNKVRSCLDTPTKEWKDADSSNEDLVKDCWAALCRCTALLGKTGNTKIAFFTSCITTLPEVRIQPVDAWFLQSFWLTTHIHAAVWLPKSCNQCVQLGAFMGHGSEQRKFGALQQLDYTVSQKKGYHPTTIDNFNNSCQIPVIFATNIAE